MCIAITYIRGELACGANVEIEVNVVLEGRVVLGDGVTIGANSLVRNSTIGERTRVNPFSYALGIFIQRACLGRSTPRALPSMCCKALYRLASLD